MKKISKSPDRYNFSRDNYINHKKENNEPISEEYLEYFSNLKLIDENAEQNPKWRENNLEYDLRSTDWILEKVRSSDEYSQHLYAALCNNDFQKLEIIPILKEEKWSCSWRYAGGIVANMKEQGDYIDWYCSGNEGSVTEEIKNDLKKLGWAVITNLTSFNV